MKKIICTSVQFLAGVAMVFAWMASSDFGVVFWSGIVCGGLMLGAQFIQDHVHINID